MKSANKIEKLAKGIRFRPDGSMDERILKAAESALDESVEVKSKLDMVTSVAIGRVVKFAVAAVIVFAISLLLLVENRPAKESPIIVATSVKSHLDYIKVGALNRAYKEGGLEGIEENYRKAFQGSDSRSEPLTTKQLLAEFNGNGKNSERENL
jgi:hypothetical protein